jgi:hypothetical protein
LGQTFAAEIIMEKAKLLVVFCEGPHDAEFLARVLKTLNGCEDYSKNKLKTYPQALGRYYEGVVKNLDFWEKNKQSIFGDIPLPVVLRQNEDTFVLIHSVGGDGKWPQAKKILQNFLDLASSSTFGKFETHFALFYDADELPKNAAYRLEMAKSQYLEIFNSEVNRPLIREMELNNSVRLPDGTALGNFVFSAEGRDIGDLENILHPMMCIDEKDKLNADIFKDAATFIDKHFNEGRLPIVDGKGKRGKFYRKKSIIGVAGQLQFSGSANTVIISSSDYLSEEKLSKDVKTQEISTFFKDIFMKIAGDKIPMPVTYILE